MATIKTIGSLAIIGGGRMGEAILAGVLDAEVFSGDDIIVTQPDDDRRLYLEETYGVRCAADNADAAGFDTVLLAVKPQIIDSVVADLTARNIVSSSTLIISIAVGVTCERLEKNLPANTPVVRVMPNTPALVGSGISVVSGGTHAAKDHITIAYGIFDAVGEVLILDEKFQDSCAALSGSGPAYFETIVDALSRAGVKHGLPRAVAQKLVVATMRGTADLIDQTEEHPQALIDQVTSPGGTTIAALEAMEAEGLRSSLGAGVNAAIRRAQELGEQ